MTKRKARRKVFYRSQNDLGDFCDNEINKDPSMTDPSQYMPIDQIVARLCRGERVSSSQPVYDNIDPKATPDQIFAAQSPVERPGFDLADVPAVLEAGAAAAAALNKQPEAPKAPPADPPAPPPAAK